jgi:endonuclease
MNEYRTIKELVIETCISEGQFPSYEQLTSLVLKHFPDSKWKDTHYRWYKSKIKTGAIEVPGFTGDEEANDVKEDDVEAEIEDTIEASLSLERDLHSYLAGRVDKIEHGLGIVENGVEYQTDAGRIDILARDKANNLVVIELKAGKAKDNALGQLLGYMGCISTSAEFINSSVRGILIASNFEQRVIYASRGLPNLKLVKYQLSFEFQEIT